MVKEAVDSLGISRWGTVWEEDELGCSTLVEEGGGAYRKRRGFIRWDNGTRVKTKETSFDSPTPTRGSGRGMTFADTKPRKPTPHDESVGRELCRVCAGG